MEIYNDFSGAAINHLVGGGVEPTEAINAGRDFGVAAKLEVTSIDPGYNHGGNTFG